MTTGVSTRGLFETATLGLPLSCLSTSSQVEAEGDQMVVCNCPVLISVRAAPLDLLTPSTKTGCPLTLVFVALNAVIRSLSQASFSGLYAMVILRAFDGACGVPLSPPPILGPEQAASITTSSTKRRAADVLRIR